MNSSDFLSIVAIAVAFFSLITQVYIGKKDVGTNLYSHVTSLFSNLNAPFLEYPQLRPYFYNGKDPEDLAEEELYRATVITEIVLDTFEWVEHDIKRATQTDKESWRDFMIGVYSQSSLVKDFHDANPSWHPLFDKMIMSKGIRK